MLEKLVMVKIAYDAMRVLSWASLGRPVSSKTTAAETQGF
jgi:hypothetical protein